MFPGKPYVGRGISGQTTPQMLVRFRQDVVALKPSVVVILAGTNDIAGNTGPSTIEMIEDNLASIRILGEEAVVQQDAVRAAEESLFHVLNQYKAGIATYLNVVTAQTAALSNARALLSVQNSQYQASINLVTALGGGFDVRRSPAPAAPESAVPAKP